ncbi:hypothetical protein AAVH_08430 [Aphelenchoides avenae]|nr:hypothetical protein AAVH_08430 [Aphelenchus avenae]
MIYFSAVAEFSKFTGLLEPDFVARKTLESIELRHKLLIIPGSVSFLWYLKFLMPWNVWQSLMIQRKFRYC